MLIFQNPKVKILCWYFYFEGMNQKKNAIQIISVW